MTHARGHRSHPLSNPDKESDERRRDEAGLKNRKELGGGREGENGGGV